jgi:hypothetical protein
MKKITIISAALAIISLACAPEAAAQFAGESGKSTITTVTEEVPTVRNYKRNAFVMQLGASAWGGNFGMGWLHNFSRHIGWDVFNSNATGIFDGEVICAQIMTGVRYNWPFTEQSNFGLMGSVRGGYGFGGDVSGACFDFAVGINFNRTTYVALAYNIQSGIGGYDDDYYYYSETSYETASRGFLMFRLGFNF